MSDLKLPTDEEAEPSLVLHGLLRLLCLFFPPPRIASCKSRSGKGTDKSSLQGDGRSNFPSFFAETRPDAAAASRLMMCTMCGGQPGTKTLPRFFLDARNVQKSQLTQDEVISMYKQRFDLA